MFRNDVNISNTNPSIPTGLTSTVQGNSVILSWHRSIDNETPSPGLTYNLRVGLTPGGVEVMSPMANLSDGYRRVTRLGNVNHDTSWTIKNLPDGTYYWSIQAIDHSFSSSFFADEDSFIVNAIEINQHIDSHPAKYRLYSNYPNPFNPLTTISYSIPASSYVILQIFDMQGREIQTLVNNHQTIGNYSVQFNAGSLASGIYFYRLQATDYFSHSGKFLKTRKMLLLR